MVVFHNRSFALIKARCYVLSDPEQAFNSALSIAVDILQAQDWPCPIQHNQFLPKNRA
jgi:hypothetical protein